MEASHVIPLPELLDSGLSLGFADQACKECRRRKSKCNRGIPVCNLCTKYRRHCLYEKHSRTPLTRKHLTEVEERLEQAEALIRQMHAVLPPHLQRRRETAVSEDLSPGDDGLSGSGNDTQEPTPASLLQTPLPVRGVSPQEDVNRSGYAPGTAVTGHQIPGGGGDPHKIHENVLESPPSTEDFEWDEQETVTHDSPGSVAASEIGDSREVPDASGAALLRILEPPQSQRRRSQAHPHFESVPRAPLVQQPSLNKHIADSMIDAYFRLYHLSYPIIHEPTFRAQYNEVIRRPNGDSWFVLAYVVAALGVFTTTTTLNNIDLDLFAHAKSLLSFDSLETGNLTMVQALTLISNYQQKRDKPNSAYGYLGLAVRMAMGLGLHKEFPGWTISPLSMEIRRRVWWSLCVFDVGATITFSRPQVWPFDGVEISLPRNVHDKDLTVMSKSYPPETGGISTYTAVRTQASFHIETNPIYIRVISKPLATAGELLQLEKKHLQKWVDGVPAYFSEHASIPAKFAFAHAVMQWRYRNLRMIMYRPFVIKRALIARSGRRDDSTIDTLQACERCLTDAKITISSITDFWAKYERMRVVAWYALYFLFQAALIPCICLQTMPLSPQAADWREQIAMALRVIVELVPVNPSADRCHEVIAGLCGPHLNAATAPPPMEPGQRDASTRQSHVSEGGGTSGDSTPRANDPDVISYEENSQNPVNAVFTMMWPNVPAHEGGDENFIAMDESSQDQINAVFTMMWPDVPTLEAGDLVMGDDAGFGFL